MKDLMRPLLVALNLWRLWPSLLLLALGRADAPIRADIRRWTQILFQEDDLTFRRLLYRHAYLMVFFREYRNLAYVRLPGAPAYRWLMPPLGSLFLDVPEIGPGCFIQHGFATIVSADRVGANFWVNQQVTIGYANETDRPVIGDDVKVRPGAKIIGKVTVGDGARVGLNTVVLRDVPPGASVFGVPGEVVLREPRPAGI
jgi:serine O-acetyltransferase